MKTIKKFTHLLLAMWLCIGMMTTTVFAAVSSQDGVEVTLTTDKESYEQGESITAAVTVTNKNEVMVTEVSLENIIPEGYKLADGSEATKQVTVLAPGETVTLTVTYVADIANSDTDKSEGGTGLNAEDIAPPTGDEISGIIWVGLLVLAGAGIVAVIATRKGKKVLSAFMSIVLAGMVLSGVPIQAKAAETNGKTIYVTETVTVAGRNVQLNATVGYQIDGNQSEEDEPTDAGEISYKEPSAEHVVMDEETGNYYVDNQVLITAEEGTTRAEIEQIISQFGGVIVGCIEITDDYQVELPAALSKAELEQIVTQLNENDAVSLALIHDLFELQFDAVPNDSEWSSEEWSANYPEGKNWGIEAIDAMGAWDYVDQMNYVKVGIIDSMFDTNHEDLVYTKVWNNPSSISSERNYATRSHGTHVSGTIAACYNNSSGIAGVAPKTTLYGYSILGSATDSIVTDSNKAFAGFMEWKYALANLITSNCKVINVSMANKHSLNQQSEVLGNFLNKLLTRGYDFVIVQAAGNAASDATVSGLFTGITIQAVRDRVIIVGAIGNNGSHKNGLFGWFGDRVFDGYYYADFSNYGNRIDVAAPGVKIYSTVPNNGYENTYTSGFLGTGQWDGTSMATPHVSGVATMCFSVNPALTGAQVKSIVVNSATTTVTDTNAGHPRQNYRVLDAAAAVELALNTQGEAVTPVNPSTGIVMGNLRGYDNNHTAVTLSDVSVSAYRISDYDGNLSQYVTATQSDSEGNYELILEAGRYYINIYKDGYLPFAICDVMVTNDQITYLDNVILIPNSGVETSSSVQGTVRNALTGDSIEAVAIKLRPGWDNRTGAIAKLAGSEVDAITMTDENGHYLLEVLEGCYTAEFTKNGYVTGYANVICTNMNNTSQDSVITPVLSDDEYRIVLTWSSTPSDLDSHISGTLSEGDYFHVFYSNMSAYDNDTIVAMLDLDDTDSYGPETITLKRGQNSIYKYAVHDYTNRSSTLSTALSLSGAKVELYCGNELIATYNVPINVIGTVWNVFEIEGGTVRTINTMENIYSPSDVCAMGIVSVEDNISITNLNSSVNSKELDDETSESVFVDNEDVSASESTSIENCTDFVFDDDIVFQPDESVMENDSDVEIEQENSSTLINEFSSQITVTN